MVIKSILKFYLRIRNVWESNVSMKSIASLLIISYVLTLLLVFLKDFGFIPASCYFIPDNPFSAIQLSFTLLLLFEVVNLVFAIEKSLSGSMIIQLEILSLILLRSAFKKFGEYHGTLNLAEITDSMLYVFADAGSALVIFIGIVLIRLWDKPLPYHMDISKLKRFINVKRLLGLILLLVFVGILIYDIVLFFMHMETFDFFKNFYTIMIFVDILIVFISLRYSNSYFNLFRNSCYALATVIIRLALSTSAPYNALMGIMATIFVMAITLTYGKISRFGIK